MPYFSGFSTVGGWHGLNTAYFDAVPSGNYTPSNNLTIEEQIQCIKPNPLAFHLFRGQDDPLPWSAITIGLSISAVWYWCTDQVLLHIN